MKTMLGIATGLVVLGTVSLASADQIHTARGKIVAAERGEVTMVLENRHRHTMEVAATTEVYDEFDRRLAPTALQIGDFVREDCVTLEDGRLVARRVWLLRAAWRELNSGGY